MKEKKQKEVKEKKCKCGNTCKCEDNCNCSNNCECNHENLQDTVKEIEDKYLRLQAEFINYRNRTEQEKINMAKYEGEEIIKSMLIIIDNFERAILMDNSDLSDEVSKFLSGFKMIYGNMAAILENLGVKEIECLGHEFDPMYMDAVLTEHNENKPQNVVLEVLTKGYIYKDKVIRHAMVKVNN